MNNNIIFLEDMKQGFKTISWNKYSSELTTQSKGNNLDYIINPTFMNTNSLSVVSFKNGVTIPMTRSFDGHYMSLADIEHTIQR